MLQQISTCRPITLAVLAGVTLLSSACVSTSKYQALEEDYATLQRANEMIVERDFELYETNVILSEEIAMRDEEIAILAAEQDELAIERGSAVLIRFCHHQTERRAGH